MRTAVAPTTQRETAVKNGGVKEASLISDDDVDEAWGEAPVAEDSNASPVDETAATASAPAKEPPPPRQSVPSPSLAPASKSRPPSSGTLPPILERRASAWEGGLTASSGAGPREVRCSACSARSGAGPREVRCSACSARSGAGPREVRCSACSARSGAGPREVRCSACSARSARCARAASACSVESPSGPRPPAAPLLRHHLHLRPPSRRARPRRSLSACRPASGSCSRSCHLRRSAAHDCRPSWDSPSYCAASPASSGGLLTLDNPCGCLGSGPSDLIRRLGSARPCHPSSRVRVQPRRRLHR